MRQESVVNDDDPSDHFL